MRRNKYNVCPPEQRTADNIIFHSKREMEDYVNTFRPLMRSGAVEVQLQVPYWLFAANDKDQRVPVCKIIVDFVVTEKDGTKRVYETKGHRTAEYIIKKKWFEACYDLRIVEI